MINIHNDNYIAFLTFKSMDFTLVKNIGLLLHVGPHSGTQS